jgi:hypothetical protein
MPPTMSRYALAGACIPTRNAFPRPERRPIGLSPMTYCKPAKPIRGNVSLLARRASSQLLDVEQCASLVIHVFKCLDGRWNAAPASLRNWPQFKECGLHDTRDEAIEEARRQYPDDQILADVRPPQYVVWRAIVRSLRVCVGLAVLYVVFDIGFSNAGDLLSRPFAQLSPLALLGGIALGMLSLVGLVAGFILGFGPPPPDPQIAVSPAADNASTSAQWPSARVPERLL